MTDAEFQTALRKISFVGVVALDEVFRGGDRTDRSTLGETLPDSTAGPVDTFEVKETKEALIQAVSQMAEREKTVLTLYYYEGLTLAEIGEILGVTEIAGVPDPHQGRAPAPGQTGRPAGGRGRRTDECRRQGVAPGTAVRPRVDHHHRQLSRHRPAERRPAAGPPPPVGVRVEPPAGGTTMEGFRQPAGRPAGSLPHPTASTVAPHQGCCGR